MLNDSHSGYMTTYLLCCSGSANLVSVSALGIKSYFAFCQLLWCVASLIWPRWQCQPMQLLYLPMSQQKCLCSGTDQRLDPHKRIFLFLLFFFPHESLTKYLYQHMNKGNARGGGKQLVTADGSNYYCLKYNHSCCLKNLTLILLRLDFLDGLIHLVFVCF